MYFVLYDRNLNSIGNPYTLESWHRIVRSQDFDELKIVGEQIPSYAEPFLVAVNSHQGQLQFSGLASTPIIDDRTNKTSISLKDYTTLWNTEILVNWSQLWEADEDSILTLEEYVDFILTCWLDQTDVGFSKIEWDTSRLFDLEWDEDNLSLRDEEDNMLKTSTENIHVYDTLSKTMLYYGIYCIPELDLYEKTLAFTFYKVDREDTTEIRLRDFGIDTIEKSFGDFNRVTVYDSSYNFIHTWAITEDNEIVKLPSSKPLVYPTKNRNFIAEKPSEELTDKEALWNATYDAVFALSQNRYQINIDLDFQHYSSILNASKLNFSTLISVYTEDGLYKQLPVGEIETDSKGKYIIRLGYRIQELTQEI